MKPFSLRTKLIIGMSIPLTILAVSMGSLVVLVGLVREKVSHSREHSLVLAATAHRMQLSAIQVQQFLSDISATQAKDGLDDGFKEAAAYHDKFLAGVAQFRAEFQATHEMAQLQTLERVATAFEEYYTVGKRMAQAYITGGPEQGNKVMPDFDGKAKQLTEALEPFIAAQTGELTSAIGAVESRTVLLRDVVLWCGSGAILLSLLLMILTNRAISGPIIQIVESLEASAAETAAAAGELAGASHQQADGAVAQSAALDRSTLTLQAMSDATNRGVENTKSVGDLIHGARVSADAGTADLQALSTTMDEIRQSSQDISAIIKSMDEIAFQTNILALNAAVEAARAGEAGAGFAVVADEVRNLAQRSAAAAKESSAKIALAMAKAAQGKEDNVKVVRRIEEILGKVREVDGLMAEFSAATTTQHSSIEQVVQGLREIDRITHDSAAQAEESASAAAELNSQAGSLRTAVHDLEIMVAGRTGRRRPMGDEENAILRGPTAASPRSQVALEA